MRWLLYPILAGVFCPPLLRAVDSAKQQEAISRIELAAAKTNIFELPSFELKADIEMNNYGKPIRGTYQLLWNGADQWKEEISLPGYSEVQVGGKGNIWVKRSTDSLPGQVHDLHQALGFGSSQGTLPSSSLVRTNLSAKDRVRDIRRKKEHGDELTCIQIEDDKQRRDEICIHDSAGTIARSEHDRDFQPVGEKVFPRILGFALESKNVVDVKIWELTSPAHFPSDAFSAPAGVAPKAGCMNPAPPRLVHKQAPQYPQAARMKRTQGTVRLDVWIGTDGATEIKKVLGNPDAALAESAVDAVKEWRYEPAVCNGQAVPVETVLQVNYALSY